MSRVDRARAQPPPAENKSRDASRAGVGALARIAVDFFSSSLSYWRLWAPQTVKVVRRASVDARLRARARRSVRWVAGCGTRACRGRGRTAAPWGFFARVSGFVSVREGRKATSEELAVVRGAATARSRALGRSRPRFFSPARTRDPHGAARLSTLSRVLSPWAFRSLPVIPA